MRIAALALALTAFTAAADLLPADPLGSPMRAFVADQAFGAGARVRFDPRGSRSPSRRSPRTGACSPSRSTHAASPTYGGSSSLVDFNPVQLPIDYRLGDAEPFVATLVKLDRRTPVRGKVPLADGSWLVSDEWIDAAGGSCSAPRASRVRGDRAQHFGEARGELWRDAAGSRAQLAFHPVGNGFVNDVSSYYIDDLTLTGTVGRTLGVKMQAAVSEDPVLTPMPARRRDGRLSRQRDQRHQVSRHARRASARRTVNGRRSLLPGAAALAVSVPGQALACRLDPQPIGNRLWLSRGIDAPIERANGGAVANIVLAAADASAALVDAGPSSRYGEALDASVRK